MRRNHKDILIGLVGTLSDIECREVYYLIKDIKEPVLDWIEFDRVRITRKQYTKLIWMWGEYKTKKCIDILNEWLIKKNVTKTISHYHNIIGWVENKYYQLYPSNDKSLRFSTSLDAIGKARKYIKSIPKELRPYDREVKYLVERFGNSVLL